MVSLGNLSKVVRMKKKAQVEGLIMFMLAIGMWFFIFQFFSYPIESSNSLMRLLDKNVTYYKSCVIEERSACFKTECTFWGCKKIEVGLNATTCERIERVCDDYTINYTGR